MSEQLNKSTSEKYHVDQEHPRVVIACRVMKEELEPLVSEEDPVELRYLDQNLHRTPEKMPDIIKAEIEKVSAYAGHIVLGYGLCSNGTVGVSAIRQPICVPRVHDCIALMLGSREVYNQAFKKRSGTYYLTHGLVAGEKDPLGMLENDYVPRMGRELAEWGIREELKHYTHIVFINTRGGDAESLRQRAKANAELLDMQYEEFAGSDSYFRKILFGPYDSEEFVCIEPGEAIRQKTFF